MLDQGADINNSNHNRTDAFGPQAPQVIGNKDYSVKVLNNVAQLGNVELFAHLVNRGADPQRSTALHAVSMCKDPEKAKAMIDHLLDVHHMDLEANSGDLHYTMFRHDEGRPVHCAVHHRNLDTLSHLILRGADPERAMQYAVGNCLYRKFLPAVGLLIDAGANADRALGRAVDNKDIEAARICLAHGADVSVVFEEQRTKTARQQARRERKSNGTWYDGDGHYDSHPSEDDNDDVDVRTQMEEFLHSVERTKRRRALVNIRRNPPRSTGMVRLQTAEASCPR